MQGDRHAITLACLRSGDIDCVRRWMRALLLAKLGEKGVRYNESEKGRGSSAKKVQCVGVCVCVCCGDMLMRGENKIRCECSVIQKVEG